MGSVVEARFVFPVAFVVGEVEVVGVVGLGCGILDDEVVFFGNAVAHVERPVGRQRGGEHVAFVVDLFPEQVFQFVDAEACNRRDENCRDSFR